MSTQISSSDFQATIDTLESEVTAGTVTSITLTDANTPTITISAAQYANDTAALNAITGSYFLDLTGVGALNAQVDLLDFHVAAVAVSDSGFTVGLELDTLEGLAKSGRLSSITLTDGSALTVSQAQLTSDADALAKMTGTVDFAITPPASSGAIAGVTGHANIVDFTALASQASFSTDGQTLTATIGANSYQLTNIEALHFTDGTELFVAKAPGDASHVDTGNITELYSAVLAREPDLDGLTFYQTYLAANPTTPLQQFAEFFLSSAEYKSNSAHNYAVSSAGDTQFITDSYQNLLHRTPSASEVNFYLTNVMDKAETGLASGSTAFANAQFQAHALMLVYFSASAEFLADVQVTATNPASAQHWLVLI
jgi:hypothetical protein